MASHGMKSDLLRRCETCEDTAELAQLVEEVENELMIKFKFKELEDACFALFVKPAILQEDLANVYLFLATTCDDSRYEDLLDRLEQHAKDHGSELSSRYEQVRNSLENMQEAVYERLNSASVSDPDEDSVSDHSDGLASSTTQSAAATMESDTAIGAATLGSTDTGPHGTADDHTPISHTTAGTLKMTKASDGTYNDVTSPAATSAADTTIVPIVAPAAAALTEAAATAAHFGTNAISAKEQHLSFPPAASTLDSIHIKIPTKLASSLTQSASSPTVAPRVEARSEDSTAVAIRGADAINDNELTAVHSISAHRWDVEDTESQVPAPVASPANYGNTSSLVTASGADDPMSTGVIPSRDSPDAGVAIEMAIRTGHVHGDMTTPTLEYTDGHGHVHDRDLTQTDEECKVTTESDREQKRPKVDSSQSSSVAAPLQEQCGI
nr:hypothetical protein B0A51_04639 [Rachicladosporium sp. CCFEE 5018]